MFKKIFIISLLIISPVFACNCNQYQIKTYPNSYQIMLLDKNGSEVYGKEETIYVQQCLIDPALKERKYSSKLEWYFTSYCLDDNNYKNFNNIQKQEYQKYAIAYIINYLGSRIEKNAWKDFKMFEYSDYSGNIITTYMRIVPKIELENAIISFLKYYERKGYFNNPKIVDMITYDLYRLLFFRKDLQVKATLIRIASYNDNKGKGHYNSSFYRQKLKQHFGYVSKANFIKSGSTTKIKIPY